MSVCIMSGYDLLIGLIDGIGFCWRTKKEIFWNVGNEFDEFITTSFSSSELKLVGCSSLDDESSKVNHRRWILFVYNFAWTWTACSLTLFIFQLILKSKAANPITLYFLMLRGPFGEMRVQPKIYHFEFAEGTNESQLVIFPLSDSAECNKILSGKSINCRFVSIRK